MAAATTPPSTAAGSRTRMAELGSEEIMAAPGGQKPQTEQGQVLGAGDAPGTANPWPGSICALGNQIFAYHALIRLAQIWTSGANSCRAPSFMRLAKFLPRCRFSLPQRSAD